MSPARDGLAVQPTPPQRSNSDAIGKSWPTMAVEAIRRKSSTAKQLHAVMLYADKWYWVEIKFVDLFE
jgi:hypothetical protein